MSKLQIACVLICQRVVSNCYCSAAQHAMRRTMLTATKCIERNNADNTRHRKHLQSVHQERRFDKERTDHFGEGAVTHDADDPLSEVR